MRPFSLPLPEVVLRIAIAVSFLYPPLSALVDPYSWIGYFPQFLMELAGNHQMLMLHVFGIVEALLALWILFGKRVFIPSVIAAMMLFAIVLLNWNQMEVLFRDISIALAAIALALLNRKA